MKFSQLVHNNCHCQRSHWSRNNQNQLSFIFFFFFKSNEKIFKSLEWSRFNFLLFKMVNHLKNTQSFHSTRLDKSDILDEWHEKTKNIENPFPWKSHLLHLSKIIGRMKFFFFFMKHGFWFKFCITESNLDFCGPMQKPAIHPCFFIKNCHFLSNGKEEPLWTWFVHQSVEVGLKTNPVQRIYIVR